MARETLVQIPSGEPGTSKELSSPSPFSFSLTAKSGEIYTTVVSVISYHKDDVARNEFSINGRVKLNKEVILAEIKKLNAEFHKSMKERGRLTEEVFRFSDIVTQETTTYFEGKRVEQIVEI